MKGRKKKKEGKKEGKKSKSKITCSAFLMLGKKFRNLENLRSHCFVRECCTCVFSLLKLL